MISVTGLSKSFGKKTVLHNLSLSVEKGRFLAVIGRSGEGKSVLLKNIIGLLHPDAGSVKIGDQEITQLVGRQREIIYKKCGYVFQFAALLDSLTIFENVGITMLESGHNAADVRALVLEKLERVGLSRDVLERYPSELSGGMRKRVGLARTLMLNPEILLYDEPTTGLDPISVRRIHELMLETHRRQKTTSVVVSHDPTIFEYVDDVAMLHEGKIIYTGPAKTIQTCDNPYIYQFIRGLTAGPIGDVTPSKKSC